MKLNTLNDLFHQELEDLYSAEEQMLRAFPRMTAAACHHDLKAAFRAHMVETQMHALRLHKIAAQLNQPLEYRLCRGMESLIEETVDLIREEADEKVRDAALIRAAQRIEHYEIAAYGTAAAMAARLGLGEAAALLQDTLVEEKLTNARLTGIAEGEVNPEAAVALHAWPQVRAFKPVFSAQLVQCGTPSRPLTHQPKKMRGGLCQTGSQRNVSGKTGSLGLQLTLGTASVRHPDFLCRSGVWRRR